MKLKFILPALVVLASLSAIPAAAQIHFEPTSATFAFGGGTAACQPITEWNGVPNAYPYDMGSICLTSGDGRGSYGSFLGIPNELGFLNNGLLEGCDPIAWDPKIYTIGDGKHAGDTFTQHGVTTCPYYTDEYGIDVSHFLDGFSADTTYVVVLVRVYVPRKGYQYVPSPRLAGGTGTATQIVAP
jgi:hypothetical protein